MTIATHSPRRTDNRYEAQPGERRRRTHKPRRSAAAQHVAATLGGFAFAALLLTGTNPLFSATPGLPFTEDFSDDSLKDAGGTTADWNTGLEQLVLPGSGPGTVSLSGTFDETSVATEVADGITRAVALGDLNGNGHPDLVWGNNTGNTVYLNDGTGDFTLAYTTSASENTRGIAIGDVNGDGSLDFVAVNFNGKARVYLNDGTGENYVVQPVTSIIRRSDSVALADINGNGLLDVVLANGQTVGPQANLLILNTGDPVHPFGPEGSQGIALNALVEPTRGVVVGDVDNDGDLDIVFLNRDLEDDVVNRIHLNTPTACGAQAAVCFSQEPINPDDTTPTRMAALGDLNGNGLLDLVLVGPGTGNVGRIYYNQDNGADVNPYTDPAVPFMVVVDDPVARYVKLADLNNNGLLDIVVVTQSPLHRNRIYFNDQAAPLANPAFASFVEIGPDPADTGSGVDDDIMSNEVAIGDLNGNGRLDLVFANQQGDGGSTGSKVNHVYFNEGTADGTESLQLRAHGTSIRVDDGTTGTIESVRLTAATTSVGPQFHNDVEFWVSSNGGDYWAPIRPNDKPITIASPGEDLRWRAFLRSISPFEAGALAVDELTLSANSLPVAVDDDYGTNQGETLTVAAPGVLDNDSDADADDLTAVLVQGTGNGTVTLDADGSFTYTPDPAFFGQDSFTYHASDGALSNVATVTIEVNGVPVANDDSFGVETNSTREVAAPGVLSNDVDPDGDPLEAVLVDDVGNGTLTLNADGSFSYEPNSDFSGTDTFTYQADDGLALSNVATVTLVVDEPNTPPVAVDDSYETVANTVLEVPAPGVLGNDTDAQEDDLTAVVVQGPDNGSLTLDPDGSFSYEPSFGFSGTDTFTYQASDGVELSNIATVTITVEPAPEGSNNPPVASDDSYSVETDGTLTVAAPGVLENDFDPDGHALTAVLGDDVNDGALTFNADGSFTYTPDTGFSGVDSFTYRATDTELFSDFATVTINVGAANAAPVANDDSYDATEDTTLTVPEPGVLENDTDADGDPLTAVLVQSVGNGTLTLNADGSFSYTPEDGFTGSDSFTYQANDGLALSNTATVTINVSVAAEPPPPPPPPPPAPPPQRRSGGGSVGLEALGLLLFAAVGVLRRRRWLLGPELAR